MNLDRIAALFDGRPRVDSSQYTMDGPELLWMSYLYGYRYEGLSPLKNGALFHFVRDDSASARRRAAWMRAPHLDPTFPPPVSWSMGAPWGWTPPGWHPGAKVALPTREERADLLSLVMVDRGNSRYFWGVLAMVAGGGAVAAWGRGPGFWLVWAVVVAALFVCTLIGTVFVPRRHAAGAARARARLGIGDASVGAGSPPGPPPATLR